VIRVRTPRSHHAVPRHRRSELEPVRLRARGSGQREARRPGIWRCTAPPHRGAGRCSTGRGASGGGSGCRACPQGIFGKPHVSGAARYARKTGTGRARESPKQPADRRILARASVCPRSGPNAQNSQLWSPGDLPPAAAHDHFAGVKQPVFGIAGRLPTVRSAPWAGVWLRSSPTDLPDSVPESYTAARPSQVSAGIRHPGLMAHGPGPGSGACCPAGLGRSANPQGKALLRHYSNCSQKDKALLTLPSTGGSAGNVGYARRGVSCGWTIRPAPDHSVVALQLGGIVMGRRIGLLVSLVALLALGGGILGATPAWATPPKHLHIPINITFPDDPLSEACGFDVFDVLAGTIDVTLLYDQSGTLVREIDTFPAFTASFTAPSTGKSIVSRSPVVGITDYTGGGADGTPAVLRVTGLQSCFSPA
jgi:hypothetical protein